MPKLYALVIAVCFCLACNAQQNEIREALEEFRDSLAKYDYVQKINVLQADGKSTLTFDASKTTSFSRMNMSMDDKGKQNLLYLFPEPLSQRFREDSTWLFTMPVGGYTNISRIDLSPHITMRGDTFFYKTNSKLAADNHFGIAMRKGNFNLFSYAWIFPAEFTPVLYKCNRQGKWQAKAGIIHFVAESDQNDFVFEIAYVRTHTIPNTLEGRSVKYVQTMDISSDTVIVIINDPQREDGDIISLNVNGEWKMRNFEVTNAQARFSFAMGYKENYIALHAENLGIIPPNTAMLTVIDGKVRKQIILNSDAGKTEAILLKRK